MKNQTKSKTDQIYDKLVQINIQKYQINYLTEEKTMRKVNNNHLKERESSPAMREKLRSRQPPHDKG